MKASLRYTAAIIFLICLVQICFNTQRHEFAILFATYAVFFMTYLWVLKTVKTETDFNFFFKISILLRGIAVLSFPNLSDDIYRFLWDGHLINLGQNPFNHPPQYFIDNQLFSQQLQPELFAKINSPNYYSVYPTVCQAVFATAVFFFPKSIYGATIVIKLFLFACEVGTLFLMKKNKSINVLETSEALHTYSNVLVYALNPLIIIELIGNAHFEAAMIFFFLWSVFLLKKLDILRGAILFSLSVVSKMLPLMFLPLFFKKMAWKRSFYFWAITVFFTLILLIPIYNPFFFKNISSSIGLYFNNFEFNASIYYIFRELGFRAFGYNMIHQITPFLTLSVVVFTLKKSFFEAQTANESEWEMRFFEDTLMVVSLYFALATTVHPWYAALPLAVSVFTKWRYPIAWTFLIVLTYAGYTEGSSKHNENVVYLIIEYISVYALFVFEYLKNSKMKPLY